MRRWLILAAGLMALTMSVTARHQMEWFNYEEAFIFRIVLDIFMPSAGPWPGVNVRAVPHYVTPEFVITFLDVGGALLGALGVGLAARAKIGGDFGIVNALAMVLSASAVVSWISSRVIGF